MAADTTIQEATWEDKGTEEDRRDTQDTGEAVGADTTEDTAITGPAEAGGSEEMPVSTASQEEETLLIRSA